MKFLCVPCDSPMKLQSLGPPDGGSLSIVYSCPECGYEMAMLTNAYETQMVQSLGVRIGPDAGAGASSPADASAADGGTGCPFAEMMVNGSTTDGVAEQRQSGLTPPVRWTAAAEARLVNIPSFIRPMARTGIERFARDSGAVEVDEQILDAAREFFGM